MHFIRILFCLQAVGLGFGFQFIKTDGSSPNSTQSTAQQTSGQVQYRQGVVSPTLVTCTCVPPGSCPVTPTLPTDGAGQIDIRIVNNPTIAPTPAPCLYGLVRCCQSGPYRCGIRYPPPPNSRAPLPGQAAFGAYPWQVAILTLNEVYLGSGALLNSRHVLTAAHKIFNVTTASYKIRLGEWDAASITEPIPAEDITVSNAFIHPNFNMNNLQNDIAVLRLSRDVDLSQKSTIATACLPTAATYVGQRCFVAGWGKDDFGTNGQFQAIQKEVDVPVISNANCLTALRATRLGPTFVLNDASFMCAGGEAGKDACTGDGGSPLVCLTNGQYQVVGLVAWGIGCAAGGVPGVYVNVLSYIPWIQSNFS